MKQNRSFVTLMVLALLVFTVNTVTAQGPARGANAQTASAPTHSLPSQLLAPGGQASDPDITVSPLAMTSTQATNTVMTQTLMISNTGSGRTPLAWTIDELLPPSPGGFYQPRRTHLVGTQSLPTGWANPQTGARFASAGTATGASVTPQRASTPDAQVTLTHSTSQAITAGNSVSCNGGAPNFYHTDNAYLRVFNLAAFGITSNLAVTTVEFGIEQAFSASASQTVTVNLYTKVPSDPLVYANLALIGTADAAVVSQTLSLVSVPVTGVAGAGYDLVVEIFTADGTIPMNTFFIGSNAGGETGPGYIAATDCGIAEPATLASIGFPNMHIVMNVTGTTSSCPVPSTVAWLSTNPISGTTLVGQATPVTVSFDSTGLAIGTYSSTLCVGSTDPDPGPGNNTTEVLVPVTLIVTAPAAVSVSDLSSTSGLPAFPLWPLAAVTVTGIGLGAAFYLRRKR